MLVSNFLWANLFLVFFLHSEILVYLSCPKNILQVWKIWQWLGI